MAQATTITTDKTLPMETYIDRTMIDVFQQAVEHHAERPALRWKIRDADGQQAEQWTTWTHQDYANDVQSLAQWLIEKGVAVGDCVGIFSQNRPQWAISDMAILSAGAISVPIYATNSSEQAEYIINNSGMRVLFVDTQRNYDKLASILDKVALECIILFDDFVAVAEESEVSTTFFHTALSEGKHHTAHAATLTTRQNAITSDDVMTLVYTSGTTGQPKGAMLTHKNLMSQIYYLDSNFDFTYKERSLCFLPLSHIYERAWSYGVLYFGIENTYLDNPREIASFLRDAQPTMLCAVPRLYEKTKATIDTRLEKAPALLRNFATWALRIGKSYNWAKYTNAPISPLLRLQYWLADTVLLSKFRAGLGGDKYIMTAGGAPLAEELEYFFMSIGIFLVQGYGLTETSPVLTSNKHNAFKFGTIGQAVPGAQLKIDPDNGELLAKGPMVAKGYYNNPEATAKDFNDGWFRTGDVASVDEEGFYRITDRIKHLIITAGGKNIAPQPIETALCQNTFVEIAVCIGDKLPYLTMLIVPDFENLTTFAEREGLEGTIKDWIQHDKVQTLYKNLVHDACDGLSRAESIKRFTILPTPFSIDTGELTPKLSVKRRFVFEKYAAEIEKMYEGH